MHLDITHAPGVVRVGISPPDTPGPARHTASFQVDIDPGSAHPDLLVLSAVLCAHPWLPRSESVTTSVAASPTLAAALSSGPSIDLSTVDAGLAPRPEPTGGVPGLCFSGGTDSVAALAVLPDSTRSYHLLRVAPAGERRPTTLDTRAARQSCHVVRRHGRPVEVVPSDVEYLRPTPGFPHDFTTAVPLLLHADRDRLDAVAWGAPLEATYRLQRGRYRDYARSPFVAGWGGVFAAVGLPVCVPVAGVSEVVTSRIVATHSLGAAAQSCVRGRGLGRPCGSCAKCARKALLAGAVSGRWPPEKELERVWSGTEPRTHLLQTPIKVEPVIAHTVHRYLADGGRSRLMELVAAKTGPDPLSWLGRSYEPALHHLPTRYRDEIAERVHRVAAPMTAAEEESVRGYDVTSVDRAAEQSALECWFDDHPPRDQARRAVAKVRREARARLRALTARG